MIPFFENFISDPYRKMGYYNDQKGILKRYRLEKKFWDEHLNNTKGILLESTFKVKGSKIAILGSGWLLDIPLHDLTKRFNEVWLFDIKHPRKIIKQTKKLTNVILVKSELSGIAKNVYHLLKTSPNTFIKDFNDTLYKQPVTFEDFDFVISCNILDQLDEILIEYIRKHLKVTMKQELMIRQFIQQKHINSLPAGKSLLVFDTVEMQVTTNTNIIEEIPLIFADLTELYKCNEWIWKFDNLKRYNENHKTWFRVEAFLK